MPQEHKTALTYIIVMTLVVLLATFFWAYISTRNRVSLQDIVRTDSGVSTEVRKAAILELVGRGSDRLTPEEKFDVMRSLSGNNVNLYGFTDAELDEIYTVINN